MILLKVYYQFRHISTQKRGIPTVVWICPLLPYINDTEENLNGILEYCREAGVYGIINFGMGLTLRDGNREYYFEKLDKYFLGLKAKYIKEYGNAYEIPSPREKELWDLFSEKCQKYGIECNKEKVF